MEQAWLYPEGKTIPKEFNEPVPDEIRTHFVDVGQNFHVPTVSKISNKIFPVLLLCNKNNNNKILRVFLFLLYLDNGITAR